MNISDAKEKLLVTNADLSRSDFRDVSLHEAQFNDVNLSNAEIIDCNVSGMKIHGILVSELFRAYEKNA